MIFSDRDSVQLTSLVILGLALATFLTHTAVVFCLHADGSFGIKMADFGASVGELLLQAHSCLDIPISLGHSLDEITSAHSILFSMANFFLLLAAFLAVSFLFSTGLPSAAFPSFRKKNFGFRELPSERLLEHTVLLL